MARHFGATTDGVVEGTSPFSTTQAMTLACWFKIDNPNDGVDHVLWSLAGVGGAGVDAIYLLKNGGGGTCAMEVVANGAFNGTSTTGSVGDSNWHFVAGTIDGSNNWTVYQGGATGTGSGSGPTLLNRVAAGVLLDSGGGFNANVGHTVAEGAVWTGVLSQDEINALEAGVNPSRIRPQNLVAYAPLWGLDPSNEPDFASHGTMAVSGTTSLWGPPVTPFRRPRTYNPFFGVVGTPAGHMPIVFCAT